MKIRVLYGYQGAPSEERLIPSGEYDSDDEVLFGLAGYLVANGHAVVVEGAEETPPPTPAPRAKRTTGRRKK